MANKQDNLTVFQKLFYITGQGPSRTNVVNNITKYDLGSNDLLVTKSRELYEKEKLQQQQQQYLQGQWTKIENELYQKAVYYETTRIASYMDFEAMEFCLAGDTKIATPDGFITIKELADKGRDFEFITYAYDHNLKQVVPAKARNAHYTRDEMTYKIIFDDDSYIIATWEHRLMKRDGSFIKVKDMKIGDSMMPFYRKSFFNNKNYNWVYTCNNKLGSGKNGWVPEHNMIAEWAYRPLKNNEEVHHIDFNGKNNNPENLSIMDRTEHRSFHAKHNNTKLWANPEYRKKMLEVSRRTDNKHRWGGARSGKNNPSYFHIPWDNIVDVASKEKTLKGTAKKLGISHTKLQREITYNGYKDWITFLDAYNIEKSPYSNSRATGDKLKINHKVKSIEPHGVIPVYDLTVPGYKNFATDTIFSHNTPEISVALDIIAEESTTPNEQGEILQVYSDSSRVKKVLTDLFYNILDINANLPMWVRNTAKYGDNFVYLKIHNQEGIVGVSQLTNIEIERKEVGDFVYNKTEDKTKKQVEFTWKGRNLDFNSWEIAHFRLLGDDRKLPYGTSVLEKARAIWKRLNLAEDAMLVYRVTRAPERRVFKVYVGNIDDADVESYVQKVANKFKRNVTPDSKTGQVDIRYNTLAVDQDFFVPVRDVNASSPIETLPGAQNLDQIADIQLLQRKLVTALRVPKAFLGFEDTVGEGKNLALLDIRFARTINRIQQAIIQELNKIAIIHLYILGFHDELNNFKLLLNNPSTQGKMLMVEQWKEKVLLYKDLVTYVDGGIAPTSHTWAKKNIFNWSADDIRLDLEQQRLERAAGAELEATPEVIKSTGLFTKIDKLYGEIKGDVESQSPEGDVETTDEGGFGDMGGDAGGFDLGGDTGGFGDTDTTVDTEFGESFNKENIIDKLLLEGKKKNMDILNMIEGVDEMLNKNMEKKDLSE
jgi:hypothetical protein